MREAIAVARSPAGAAYRGRVGCKDPLCSTDGHPDRCYGWHCVFCHGRSNMQGDCGNLDCPAKR